MKKRPQGTTQIVLRISVDKKNKLKARLAEEDTTMSEWLREKIREKIDEDLVSRNK